MNSDKKNIDKIIKAKIGDHEMLPDDDSWNSIEASLAKKNKFRNIYPGIVVVAVCIVSLLLFYKYNDKEQAPSSDLIKADSIQHQTNYLPDNRIKQKEHLKEMNAPSCILKDQIINHTIKNDSLQEKVLLSRDSLTQPVKEIAVIKDTSAVISAPIKNTVHKKIVKKPVYIIQQDTIYKIDTLKRKRIK